MATLLITMLPLGKQSTHTNAFNITMKRPSHNMAIVGSIDRGESQTLGINDIFRINKLDVTVM